MDTSFLVIDTSVYIEFIRAADKSRSTLARMTTERSATISAVTAFELWVGATNDSKRADLQVLLEGVPVLPLTAEIASLSAQIYLSLKRKSQLIEYRDIFIAATAMYHNVPLKTLNINHFSRIEGLTLA